MWLERQIQETTLIIQTILNNKNFSITIAYSLKSILLQRTWNNCISIGGSLLLGREISAFEVFEF